MDAGEQFGPYVLHERIGAGGMAEIFRATSNSAPGGEVVIKRILPTLSDDQQFIQMFINEAKLSSALRHPNIVQVYDLGWVDETYFIAMEYVVGRDLLKTLGACARSKTPFPTALALHIVSKVLTGLNYAHDLEAPDGSPLGIIHRDLSPSNVLLSYDGSIKLSDFGIAKASNREKTATGILKGKFGYMSPEQVVGGGMDRRSDVFSAGILLYELLTGRRLFGGGNDLQVLERVRDAKIEPPPTHYRPDLDRDLEQIVLRALSRRKEKRFQSAGELATALTDYMTRVGVQVTVDDLSEFMHRVFPEAERTAPTPAPVGRPESGLDAPEAPRPEPFRVPTPIASRADIEEIENATDPAIFETIDGAELMADSDELPELEERTQFGGGVVPSFTGASESDSIEDIDPQERTVFDPGASMSVFDAEEPPAPRDPQSEFVPSDDIVSIEEGSATAYGSLEGFIEGAEEPVDDPTATDMPPPEEHTAFGDLRGLIIEPKPSQPDVLTPPSVRQVGAQASVEEHTRLGNLTGPATPIHREETPEQPHAEDLDPGVTQENDPLSDTGDSLVRPAAGGYVNEKTGELPEPKGGAIVERTQSDVREVWKKRTKRKPVQERGYPDVPPAGTRTAARPRGETAQHRKRLLRRVLFACAGFALMSAPGLWRAFTPEKVVQRPPTQVPATRDVAKSKTQPRKALAYEQPRAIVARPKSEPEAPKTAVAPQEPIVEAPPKEEPKAKAKPKPKPKPKAKTSPRRQKQAVTKARPKPKPRPVRPKPARPAKKPAPAIPPDMGAATIRCAAPATVLVAGGKHENVTTRDFLFPAGTGYRFTIKRADGKVSSSSVRMVAGRRVIIPCGD